MFWQLARHLSSVHKLLREATKPTFVFTDEKSITRFFRIKAISLSMWNPCDYVLQFNFIISNIAGSINTTSDFFSRLVLKFTEKIRLKIQEDTQTTPNEMTTSSSDVADEEQFSLHTSRRLKRDQRTDPWKEKKWFILEQRSGAGNKRGTTPNEFKSQSI